MMLSHHLMMLRSPAILVILVIPEEDRIQESNASVLGLKWNISDDTNAMQTKTKDKETNSTVLNKSLCPIGIANPYFITD